MNKKINRAIKQFSKWTLFLMCTSFGVGQSGFCDQIDINSNGATPQTNALEQISSKRFGAVFFNQFNTNSEVSDRFSQHTEAVGSPKGCQLPDGTYQVWVDVIGSTHKQKRQTDRVPHKKEGYGALGGFVWQLSDVGIGVGVGYTRDKIDFSGNGGNAHTHAGHLAVNATWGKDNWFIGGGVQGSRNSTHSERKIAYGTTTTVNETAKADFSDYSATLSFAAGLNLPLSGNVYVAPKGSISTVGISQKSFKERGAPALNLEVARVRYVFMRTQAELNFYTSFNAGAGCVQIGVAPGFQYDATVNKSRIKARLYEFANEGSFNVKIYDQSKAYASIRGFAHMAWDQFDFELGYTYKAGTQYQEHQAGMSLSYGF